MVMKAVEMLGVCWGPVASAGVHGTCKCSVQELPEFGPSRFWVTSLTRCLRFGGGVGGGVLP